jgi:formylglycine-generating enzyme required for sulfatase activity
MKSTLNQRNVFACVLYCGFISSCSFVDKSRHIDGFTALGKNAEGLEEYKHDATGIRFILVPGGEFLMGGGTINQEGKQNALPEHKVSLDDFLLAKFEVTQAEWARVTATLPMRWQTFQGHDIPVHGVSWDECADFCKAAGLKLPTEAQWEFACRSGNRSGSKEPMEEVNCASPGQDVQDILAGKPKSAQGRHGNALGFHDMRGNVCEWCLDSYSETFYAMHEALERNPINLKSAGFGEKVYRGGSWLTTPEECNCGWRGGSLPDNAIDSCGVRPAYYPLPISLPK